MVELELESFGGEKRNKEEHAVSCEEERSDSDDDIIADEAGYFLELFFDEFTVRDFRNARNQWHPSFEKVIVTAHGLFTTKSNARGVLFCLVHTILREKEKEFFDDEFNDRAESWESHHSVHLESLLFYEKNEDYLKVLDYLRNNILVLEFQDMFFSEDEDGDHPPFPKYNAYQEAVMKMAFGIMPKNEL
jgi:hypothetical protein